MTLSFVSIIIPVFNDSERLKLCLQALENQTYPHNMYEVIVVDNASDEDTKSIVEKFNQAVFTEEVKTGSYAARNKGISLAKGEILAFTDSDCIPASDWIENGVKSLLSTPNCGLVAGRIDFFFQNPEQPTPVELYETFALPFNQDLNVEDRHYGVTANLFTFKHVIDSIGSFNHQLKSGGDREWGERVFAAGYKQIYANDAYVAHPARHSFSQLRKRVTRLTGGKVDRLMIQKPSRMEIAADILDSFKPPFRTVYLAWKHEKCHSIYQKIQCISVLYLVRYIAALEKVRLYLGGSSDRG
ncbi:glycosyl transferase, group 2 family protein [Calothrix sp. NIES-2100]|uniref:glycosyltransferase n=1 Tax=Calothrix sp. NIES-2100 TaxID=1954172 RepID=UPI000B61B88E|nr:glycosyl transferase, group 2 family protein [Calothrix sp. NIES-2100]